jgi:hypothetical protein
MMSGTEFKTKYFALRLAISKMSLQLIACPPEKRDTYEATFNSLVCQMDKLKDEYARQARAAISPNQVTDKLIAGYLNDIAGEYEQMDRAASVLIKLAYEKAGALTG